jgi:TonB family protein
VSSAANTVPPGSGTHGNDTSHPTRPNAIALEIPVTVTGAKVSSTAGSRDLFTEESSTLEVFKDGAVISLGAPIGEGQLLFLTNKKTNQEVVCQVVGKRDFQPPTCHVELQFTEERDDYWGVQFPANPAKAEAKVQQKAATGNIPAPAPSPATPRNVEGPHGLDNEVQALRKQLLAVDTKHPKGDGVTTSAGISGHAATMNTAAKVLEVATAGVFTRKKEELAPVNDPTPATEKPAPAESLLMPAAKDPDKNEAARAVIGMALPISSEKIERKAEEPTDAAEDLLPKADLDFSRIPNKAPEVKSSKTGVRIPVPAFSKGRLIALAAVLLLALGGGAWYGKWWQLLPARSKTPTVAARPVATRSMPKTPPSVAAAKTPEAPNGNSTQANGGAGNSAVSENQKMEETKLAEADAPSVENRSVAPPQKSATAEQPSEDSAPAEAAQTPATTEVITNDGPMTPPKLVKAANPVYPPDAMRSYITGDVKAEVIVDASGHVKDVAVLSGPQALRAAAMDALKQYQYAPAMQGSKAVEGKTTAVVKFWFNP